MTDHRGGTLYLCATPIGNLGDITVRAIELLRGCDCIAAENRGHTLGLLSHYGIDKPLVSYREENRINASLEILNRLRSGETVALVSDAGTPGISDPGTDLVRRAIDGGFDVVALPGPNAAVTGLVLSGFSTVRYSYEGFPPRKAGPRRRLLKEIANDSRTLVFYESPQRIHALLDDIVEVMGPQRGVALCRELTKKFEEVLRGTALEVREVLGDERVRGEIVLVVEGGTGATEGEGITLAEAVRSVRELKEKGVALKAAVGAIAPLLRGHSKNELYNASLEE